MTEYIDHYVAKSDALAGGTLSDRGALVWHFPHYHGSGWRPGTAIRVGDWKLVKHYESEKIELFNLTSDPGESNDVAADFPDEVGSLEHALADWFDDTGAAVPTRREAP